MLKKEVLKANAVLAGLTDEQIAAIEQLSENDEKSVINQTVGEIHRQYDETIEKATGVKRDGAEKSYKYLERAATELRTKAQSAETLQTQITDLQTEKTRLEKAIAEGGNDTELKNQLNSVKAELEQTKGQFNDLQSKTTEVEKTYTDKLHGMRVDYELNGVRSKVAFKKDIPESATKVLLEQVLSKVRTAYKPDFVDDGKGGERLVFKNEAGVVQNNPDNMLNPYTADELVMKELKTMGVLDEGRKQKGGGTNPPTPSGGSGSTTLDLSNVKTKNEANDIITQTLLSQGLTKGSKDFQEKLTEAWKDNNVIELPD